MAVTQKQIAEAAGVSRGTVDRVLHGRGRVKAEVQERVFRIAREMQYQPNAAGQALVKSSAPKKLGVVCQFSETPFMKLVAAGMERAREELDALGGHVTLITIESYDVEKMIDSLDALLRDGVQGLALTPGNAPEIHAKLREIAEAGIPVITFNTDAPESSRLCYVGLDNYRAGTVCADLMHTALRQQGGLVLPISGYEGHQAHSQRLAAFQQKIRDSFPSLTLLPPQMCSDTDAVAEKIVLRALEEHPDLQGIYLSGNGQAGVCRALRSRGRTNQVCVICYDLTEANIRELNRGGIDFLIDQNAFEQGYRPARMLYDYLMLNREPEREFYYTDITIKTRYNL